MTREEELSSGICRFPEQMFQILEIKEKSKEKELILSFWDNIWFNFLKEKPVDTLTWLLRFDNHKLFNNLLYHLSKSGWITSEIDMNYATIKLNESKLLKWIHKNDLTRIKFKYKFSKYRLDCTKSVLNNIVQVNGKNTITGLIRNGFMKAGNNKFSYDTKYIEKYIEGITWNIEKGLKSSTREITYQEICDELLDYYSIVENVYTLGNNISDSRGRSIFQCSKKIFNPVSHKDARACIKLIGKDRRPINSIMAINRLYAFIAELLGYKTKSYTDKVMYGISAYKTKRKPDYEEMKRNQDFDELHVLIWLERIYEALDNNNLKGLWEIPIEIDATASMVQIIGILINDHTYLDKTNVIGDELKDMWTIEGIPRNLVKKALTPIIYGSSAHPVELWTKHKYKFTQEMVNIISLQLLTGEFANAKKFKDFIINNVNPKTKTEVSIWNDKFFIECNRFKWEETIQKVYWVYTSSQGKMKKITKDVNLIPDLEQFKRYFVTLLIHNLDSQIANHICEEIAWVLPNHDAYICHPEDAHSIAEIYINQLYKIYKHRKEILHNYFKCIGITKTFEEKNNEELTRQQFRTYCLK